MRRMPLIEVTRAASMLARAWTGSPPADLRGRELCRQITELLRQHDPGLVDSEKRSGVVPDARRLEHALSSAAAGSVAMRALLGHFAAPVSTEPASRERVEIDGNRNHVFTGETVHVLSTLAGAPAKPRILFLAANPVDTVPLRLDKEQREIREALVLTGDRYSLEPRPAVRPHDLTLALMQLRPRIVHFSGHGKSDGAICLENETGETHRVTPEALGSVFGVMDGEIECVVLNACFSSRQAVEISRHVRYVVGMTQQVGDDAAIAFATGFYQGVGSGSPIRQSVAMGRGLFNLKNLSATLAPVLLVGGEAVD